MKEILSSQCDSVTGGWQDRDGSGHKSSNNGGSGSSGGGRGDGGNSGNHGPQSFASMHSPYGSGSGASGYWGGEHTFHADKGSNSYGGRGHGGTRR